MSSLCVFDCRKKDHSGTPADTINFTKLLAAIRAALDMLTVTTGKKYGLTGKACVIFCLFVTAQCY